MAIFNLTYLRSLMEDVRQKQEEISLFPPDETNAEITYLPHKLQLYWPGCIDSPYYHYKKAKYHMKESPKLRKGTQHYHRIVRKDDKVLCIDSFVGNQPDGVLIMHYEENKRYALPYPKPSVYCRPEAQVVTYQNGHIAEDYMIRGNQIVYRKYAHIEGEKYAYYDINYVPSGCLPIIWIRIGTITSGCEASREIDFDWPTYFNPEELGLANQLAKLAEIDPAIVEP